MDEARAPGGERLTEAGPPSEPRATRSSLPRVQGGTLIPERTERPQLVVALVVGLALVAVPLYLWRRPRTPRPEGTAAAEGSLSANVNAAFGVGGTDPVNPSAGASQATGSPSSAGAYGSVTGAAEVAGDTGASVAGPVALGEIRVASCHDPGPRRTPPAECDHLPTVEQSLVRAIQSSAACVPEGGGTIEFQLDASFGRKKRPMVVTAPREGRTVKSPRVIAACVAQVKKALATASLDGVAHAHTRYKVTVSATYPREPVPASAVPPPATGLSAASSTLVRHPQAGTPQAGAPQAGAQGPAVPPKAP